MVSDDFAAFMLLNIMGHSERNTAINGKVGMRVRDDQSCVRSMYSILLVRASTSSVAGFDRCTRFGPELPLPPKIGILTAGRATRGVELGVGESTKRRAR